MKEHNTKREKERKGVFLTSALYREGVEDFGACLEAVRNEAGPALRGVEQVYAATILGDMAEEQATLAGPRAPMALQKEFLGMLRGVADVPVTLVSTACVSGATALALARARIIAGHAQRVGVLAFEQCSPFLSEGFGALRCLTNRPAPYTRERSGFRLAPGFGWLLLSSHHEKGGGIRLAGAATTNDAAHLTGPDREGRGLRRAIESALRQAGAGPLEVDAIKLNGAGTGPADASEYQALRACFGDRLPEIPCLCLKPVIGHMQGACGVVETILASEALRLQHLPGIPQAMRQDAEFPFFFPERAGAREMKKMLLLYSGMGGQNAALILEREDG
ncbi:MAG: beta-ketoacyl synthase N-terminal-like domain-containing protein [Kiritimatiellae bacterium]|nr:beta-ketoacyl synthase N-terminal-like domain-containing protein [Kiritimatiellia bacterium]